jgi:transaldolase
VSISKHWWNVGNKHGQSDQSNTICVWRLYGVEDASWIEGISSGHKIHAPVSRGIQNCREKQSPWYDNLRRPVTILEPLINSGVRGVTSNPTIFEKAIAGSDAYDDQFRQLIREGKSVEDAYWALVVQDIQDACDLFRALYDESEGGDGYISVEVSPLLANETERTIESANYLHKTVNRPNVLIKIPATAECIPSIKQVIASSISVNVTLIFSLQRYEAVIDAYLDGLEEVKGDLSKISSVASFFVSRVDSFVDKKLEAIGTEEALDLCGKVHTVSFIIYFILVCLIGHALKQEVELGHNI